MKLILKSPDNDMWPIVEKGNFVPRVDQNDPTSIAKEKNLWITDEKIKVLLNSKVQLFLTCALTNS